ncbi:winged helix-turn-helix domain-containing protein [Streptomyces collinus]|uniref:winged helix-turn-helix domain-containing protein n=1 Tax=Streptomyces collinus TaxID=42684 RepID=UPI0036EB1F67
MVGRIRDGRWPGRALDRPAVLQIDDAFSQMLHRHGWNHQVPARRALERDEAAVAGWVKDV